MPKLIYELNARGFTKCHPSLTSAEQGTLAGLLAPDIIEYFVRLGVDVIEMMPIAAWVDERHLVAEGLANCWGYNPVGYFVPDPRLMPNGIADLRAVTDTYRARGIAVILDVVYNHTGESDLGGPTLSYRGLDALTYYRHATGDEGLVLANDTGTGNTLRTDHPVVQDLVLHSLRFWVEQGGVSGFRFDLAPVLGRGPTGFDRHADLLTSIKDDQVLSQCLLVAEPWDPGPGGYHLGEFGSDFSEWNDKYRDDVRRYWRGDAQTKGDFATRLAGSSDVFDGATDVPSRGVNFLAVHDGFTLQDQVSYAHKHNAANGEQNRDGHSHNYSWNCGVEGLTDRADILRQRRNDVRAMLASLFVSRGIPLLQQGDEFGRTQGGNNNAYAQDNATTWLDWANIDKDLADFVAKLNHFRAHHPALSANNFFDGKIASGHPDIVWLQPENRAVDAADWGESDQPLGMHLAQKTKAGLDEVLVWFNRTHDGQLVHRVGPHKAGSWQRVLCSAMSDAYADKTDTGDGDFLLPARSVTLWVGAKSIK